jgi:hypothetical protein
MMRKLARATPRTWSAPRWAFKRSRSIESSSAKDTKRGGQRTAATASFDVAGTMVIVQHGGTLSVFSNTERTWPVTIALPLRTVAAAVELANAETPDFLLIGGLVSEHGKLSCAFSHYRVSSLARRENR